MAWRNPNKRYSLVDGRYNVWQRRGHANLSLWKWWLRVSWLASLLKRCMHLELLQRDLSYGLRRRRERTLRFEQRTRSDHSVRFVRSCSFEYFRVISALIFEHFCKRESTQVNTISFTSAQSYVTVTLCRGVAQSLLAYMQCDRPFAPNVAVVLSTGEENRLYFTLRFLQDVARRRRIYAAKCRLQLTKSSPHSKIDTECVTLSALASVC